MTDQTHNGATREHFGNAVGLLRSLVPSAQDFCYYDSSRACAWSSFESVDFEIDNYVSGLPAAPAFDDEADPGVLRRTLTSGRTLLVLAVQGSEKNIYGLFVTVFSKNAGKSSSFDAKALSRNLLPAIRFIGENLQLKENLKTAEGRADEAELELKLVYQVDEKIHGTSRSHAGLSQLIGHSGRFLGITYSVLLMPAKRIRISATHTSWKNVNRKVLDKYLIETLFPKLEGQRSPAVFEIPPVPDSDNIADQGYQIMACPLVDRMGNVEGILAQLGRVSGAPFRASHLRFMSHIVRKVEYVIEQSFDSMTGLMNRAGFEAQLNESMRALAGENDAHQLMYLDLDNLQLVNDTFGQEAGDEVITRFAQIIEEHLPRNAVATRLTGDDFAVLLTHSALDDAIDLATRIRDDSDKLRYLHGDKSLQVTVSIGVAPFDSRTTNELDVLTTARIACDSAKDHGRDRVEVYDQDDQSIVRRFDDMHLVAEIQKVLDGDGFDLLAQPIVGLKKRLKTKRYEILLRMQDSQGNKISSKSFFSAAERYQIMPAIDRWVISETLGRIGAYAGFLRESGTVFAINLSGQSLGDDEILKFIENEIDSSGVPAEAICFEVTESAAVSNRAKAQAFIDALQQRGCKFSLDDFGAGLSSFAYLKSFKVDTLKIDGSFIRDITENRISESMVAAITQVAKVMELETVAEYVENKESMALI
ncbi:MAG TPA: EAL domain-containing protein, partial [Woeseiaceae bacterium]|nr:EAL domain-containing protein [Woeseiaceae bacterium]